MTAGGWVGGPRPRRARHRAIGWRVEPLAVGILAGWLAIVGSAGAQKPKIATYDVDDGLPSSTILGLEQDRMGRLWILSRSGISVYDGREFRTFTSSSDLPGTMLAALAAGADGRVWTVTRSAAQVFYHQDATWHRLPPLPAAPSSQDPFVFRQATALAVATSEETSFVAVGTNDVGLVVWDGEAWTLLGPAQGLASPHVTSLEVDGERVAVGTAAGLCWLAGPGPAGPRIDCSRERREPRLEGPIFALHASGDGAGLWVLGSGWLGRLEHDRLDVVAEGLDTAFSGQTTSGDVAIDTFGGVYFGTPVRAYYREPEGRRVDPIGMDDGLASEGVTTLLVDREANVWLGSQRGLSCIASRRFVSFDRSQGLLENEVTAVLEPVPGELILGHNRGLSWLSAEGVETIDWGEPDDGRRNAHRALDLAMHQGTVWVAAQSPGLIRLTADRHWTVEPKVPAPVFSVEVTGEGELWVAGQHGLYRRDGKTFERVDPGFGRRQTGMLRWLAAGADGRLYVATRRGVLWRDEDGWALAAGPSDASSNVYNLLPEDDGTVWVGTLGGLYQLADGALRPADLAGRGIDRPVYFILRDAAGRLWIGTDDGVRLWDGGEPRVLTRRQGLAGRETNRGAGLVDHRGRVWVGTEQGVSMYQAAYDTAFRQPPIVDLRAVEAGGRLWPATADAELAHHDDTIVFHVDTITLVREQDVLHRYRLVGFDDRWTGPMALSGVEIRYTNLPPGRYRFQVAARRGDGRWGATASTGSIVIARPFWRRSWFYLLALAAAALVVTTSFRYRTRAIRNRNSELQAINVELQKHIAERRQATAALRASEEQYRSVVSALTEGIAVYDAAGRPVAHNASAERILGLTADQIAGRSLLDPSWHTMHEDGSPFLVDEWPAMVTLREGRALEGMVMGVFKPGGELTWISINTQPIFRGGELPSAVVASFTDITRRKSSVAERESLIADLESKNAELERFTYTVSHDLKSPLVTIKGFLGLLTKDASAGNVERMSRDIARISAAAGTMGRLLDELLELSRVGRVVNRSEDLSLGELAREAVEVVLGDAEGSRVEVEIAPDLPVVFGDRVRLLEVLQNLVENARKFMGDQPAPRIEIGVRHEQPDPVFFVRDNGIGIDPLYQERVFGLFDRLEPSIEGTGVGLTLVRRIVEVHGGQVWVESEGLGHGTTFCWTLPPPESEEHGEEGSDEDP